MAAIFVGLTAFLACVSAESTPTCTHTRTKSRRNRGSVSLQTCAYVSFSHTGASGVPRRILHDVHPTSDVPTVTYSGASHYDFGHAVGVASAAMVKARFDGSASLQPLEAWAKANPDTVRRYLYVFAMFEGLWSCVRRLNTVF